MFEWVAEYHSEAVTRAVYVCIRSARSDLKTHLSPHDAPTSEAGCRQGGPALPLQEGAGPHLPAVAPAFFRVLVEPDVCATTRDPSKLLCATVFGRGRRSEELDEAWEEAPAQQREVSRCLSNRESNGRG